MRNLAIAVLTASVISAPALADKKHDQPTEPKAGDAVIKLVKSDATAHVIPAGFNSGAAKTHDPKPRQNPASSANETFADNVQGLAPKDQRYRIYD